MKNFKYVVIGWIIGSTILGVCFNEIVKKQQKEFDEYVEETAKALVKDAFPVPSFTIRES